MEDLFKKKIREHLEGIASTNALFAKTFANPDKNIDDCATYICNQVQASGRQGFADEEIYGMAIHYYDEADIEIGKPMSGKVVVNYAIELSEEEQESARKEAQERLVKQQMDKISGKGKKAKKQESNNSQPTLF